MTEIDLGLDTRDTGLSYHPQTLLYPSRSVTTAPTPSHPASPGSLFALANAHNKQAMDILANAAANTSINTGDGTEYTNPYADGIKTYGSTSRSSSLDESATFQPLLSLPATATVTINGEPVSAGSSTSEGGGLPLAVATAVAAALGPSATVSYSQTVRVRPRSLSRPSSSHLHRRNSIPPSSSINIHDITASGNGYHSGNNSQLSSPTSSATTSTSSAATTSTSTVPTMNGNGTGLASSLPSSGPSSTSLSTAPLLPTVNEDQPLLIASLPSLVIPVGDLEVTAPILMPVANNSIHEPEGRELYFRNAIAMAVFTYHTIAACD
jgi:hypothetical protein